MLLFRIRFTIRATDRVARLPAIHAALVYALLCEAYGKGSGQPKELPPRSMVIAPEQLRIHLNVGQTYSFGMTLVSTSVTEAAEVIRILQRGLTRHGVEKPTEPNTLAGNFELVSIDDLIAGRPLTDDCAPLPLSPEHVLAECRALQDRPPILTLRFSTPLRWQLTGTGDPRKLYYDRRHFDAARFLQKIPQRFTDCGLDPSLGPCEPDYRQAAVLDNRLVWIDCDYRSGRRKKLLLSGAKGRIRLQLPEDYPVHWLVWCQYLQLGWSTRFGLGAYRIEELGPEPFPCRRSQSLLELALQSDRLEGHALVSDTSPAVVREAAEQVVAGVWQPLPSILVPLEQPGEAARQLKIPQPVDRALQRCVLDVLAPGLDDLFEKSSFAFRRGLGRHHAAAEIEKAWKQGYRWAVQADFERFFDSIEHRELDARIHAYIDDDLLQTALLRWMEVARDANGRGLPTGAPLSPVLANMFLDRFDERIRREQGWLVRYADDFLILTRTRESAEALFAAAHHAASDLLLKLNSRKQRILNLSEPFRFLGFQFEKRQEWRLRSGQAPEEIQRLGWRDVSRDRPDHATKFLLPGESYASTALTGMTCIVDDDAAWLGVQNGCLTVESAAGSRRSGPTLDSIHQLLVTGCVTLDASLWRGVREHNISLLMADEAGNLLMEWLPDDAARSAELLTAQVDAARNPQLQLAIARQLISAKLENYAGLAQVIPTRSGPDSTADRLRELAISAAHAESVPQLLGYEGAAAAAWYGSLSGRLPTRFPFPGRRAPKAHDPVNVLLNIAQTHIYRQTRLALRLHGLDPAIGLLHTAAPGHAALASDLQEVFRMLADRAAIETAWKAQYRDFRDNEQGHYPLVATATIRQRLLKTLYQSFSQTAISAGSNHAYSFRAHLLRLARSLKTVLLQGEGDLRIYRCPISDPSVQDAADPQKSADPENRSTD